MRKDNISLMYWLGISLLGGGLVGQSILWGFEYQFVIYMGIGLAIVAGGLAIGGKYGK